MPISSEDIDALFPLPSSSPSALCPTPLTGTTHQSKVAVIKALKDNHILWHAYLNDMGFHNHCSHHLLATYSLGAGPSLIEATYQRHTPELKAAMTGVDPITPNDYFDHLGKSKFYNSYRQFYAAEILRKGVKAVIEEYIFSREANIVPAGVKNDTPGMLTRLLSGLIHPMIHAGYGLEFGLPGLLAEGLAQAATHPIHAPSAIPDSYFDAVTPATLRALPLPLSATSKLSLERVGPQGSSRQVGTHALDILGRIIKDDMFDPVKTNLSRNPFEAIEQVISKDANKIYLWVDEWYAGGKDVSAKLAELFWLNTVMYGVGGWARRSAAPGGEFNADFFLMHLVTSALFMPSYAAYLSPTSFSLLARAYMTASLAWFVARGRPALPFPAFYAEVSAHPAEPGAPHGVAPAPGALDAGEPSPNGWLPIVQSTLQHKDDHIHKCQRSLLHFARMLSATPPGTFKREALEGAEVLDGTLFIRVAGLTAGKLGWMREGQEDKGWDRVGLF